MKFSIYQDTHIGARAANQDRMGYCFTRECVLMVLADGMGGHLRGDVAAQVVVQSVAGSFQRQAQPALPDPRAFLAGALLQAHQDILAYTSANRLPDHPRTTVVAAVVQGGVAWWAHAGDSRLYWIRGRGLIERTRDHSKVETLLAMGLIDASMVESHPERNKVLSCLGSPQEPTIELGRGAALRPGDTLLLCSDGVWAALSETSLLGAVAEAPVGQAVPELVRRAVAAAGRVADNATALAMRWESPSIDAAQLSSGDLPEGAVTTNISIGQIEQPVPRDIPEDEIERAISEIRSAIARSDNA